MSKINIFDVDRHYTEWLQKKEIEEKGYTTVPNMDYEDEGRFRKFFAGPVIVVNNQKYYVGATHKTILNNDSLAIIFKDEPGVIKGTLRFQYMIPVPEGAIEWRDLRKEEDPSRKRFMFKYLKSLEESVDQIKEKAYSVYTKRVQNELPEFLNKRFNDFKFLESKMVQYELNRILGTLETNNELEVKYDEKTSTMYIDYGEYKRNVERKHLKDINNLAHIVDGDLDDIEFLNTIDVDPLIDSVDNGIDIE